MLGRLLNWTPMRTAISLISGAQQHIGSLHSTKFRFMKSRFLVPRIVKRTHSPVQPTPIAMQALDSSQVSPHLMRLTAWTSRSGLLTTDAPLQFPESASHLSSQFYQLPPLLL